MPVRFGIKSSPNENDKMTLRNLSCFLELKVHKEIPISKQRTSKTILLWAQASLPYFSGTKHKPKEFLPWSGI